MVEKLDLQPIKARLIKASSEPWMVDENDSHGMRIRDNYGWLLLNANITCSDAEFAAHARQDVPALIKEVETLRLSNEDLGAEVERLKLALEQAHEFISAIVSFYGTNVTVANFHLNGDHEPFDNFIDENAGHDVLKTVRGALGIKEEGTNDENRD